MCCKKGSWPAEGPALRLISGDAMPICSPDAAFHSHTVLTGGHIGVL